MIGKIGERLAHIGLGRQPLALGADKGFEFGDQRFGVTQPQNETSSQHRARRDRNADNKINKLNIKQMFAGQTHGPFSTF